MYLYRNDYKPTTMHINSSGTLSNSIEISSLTGTKKAQPVFDRVKSINDIYLANAVKSGDGYIFNQESMRQSVKQLISYLKFNP